MNAYFVVLVDDSEIWESATPLMILEWENFFKENNIKATTIQPMLITNEEYINS